MVLAKSRKSKSSKAKKLHNKKTKKIGKMRGGSRTHTPPNNNDENSFGFEKELHVPPSVKPVYNTNSSEFHPGNSTKRTPFSQTHLPYSTRNIKDFSAKRNKVHAKKLPVDVPITTASFLNGLQRKNKQPRHTQGSR